MNAVTEIFKKQVGIGNAIEKLSINYSKDSKDRKTKDYLRAKSSTLEELWKEFETNDDQIRELCPEPNGHDYFVKDFYIQVEKIYLELKTDIERRLSQSVIDSKNEKPTTSKQAASVDDRLVPLTKRLNSAMITLRNIMESAAQVSGDSKGVVQHLIERIRKYLNIMEEKEQAIMDIGNGKAITYSQDEYQEVQLQGEQMLLQLQAKLEQEPRQQVESNYGMVMQPMMQLSKISVPKFSGDHSEWSQFHDLFTQLVHNQGMTNAMKMFYLKDNLSGEAEKLIRHLTVSEANYEVAWSILKDKYDDKRELLNRWLDTIVNQRQVTTESAEALKNLHDAVREATLAIESLNIPTKQLWESMVLYLVAQKLDNTSRTLYEQSLDDPQELQPLGAFIKFLQTRYKSLSVHGGTTPGRNKGFKTSMVTSSAKLECVICNKDHAVYNCESFLKLNESERNDAAFKAKLCLNCLKKGHFANKCKSRSCVKCGKRHNTLLHSTQPEKTIQDKPPTVNVSSSMNVQTHQEVKTNYAFLGTALIEAKDKNGNWIKCRALIDPGSQVHIVTERLRKKLKLDEKEINTSLAGLGESRIKINKRLNVEIRSRNQRFITTLDALVMKSITSDQPQTYIEVESWPIADNMTLADPRFNIPQQVDILIGVELYSQLIIPSQKRLGDGLPILQASSFGWIIMGSASINDNVTNQNSAFCGIGTLDLDEQIKEFWALEEYLPQQRMTVDEIKCERFFDATTTRENGRFIVNIPFKNSPSVLGDSKAMAYKRLMSMERKLSANPELRKQYVEFMRDYEQQGHMQVIEPSKITQPCYYLPHHCVLKPSSSTTKLRVVFDASAKSSNNISLNEIMFAGPRIQDELFAIILRFRTKRYVFTADIRQMYRQINISSEDRNLQLILWREKETDTVKTFQLSTVTYGTKAAPYLATKCLQRLAEDEEDKFPIGARAVKDFYVDDIITGADDINEAVEIQTQLRSLLEAGGFQLRKWCANHPRLIQNIAEEDLEIQLDFNQKQDEYTKPLGLIWLPVVDQFQTTVNLKQHQIITKRTILSDTAQLFDPLGLVNPVIVSAKIFMQQLWKIKLDWDEEVPAELQSKWLEYRDGLAALRELKIPRYMFAPDFSGRIVLHAFADANERAYGTAIYLRTINNMGEVHVRLLCAKSRVAPLKQTKLPLLELCAAKMAAELVKIVTGHITVSIDDIYYWSDSAIVLSWIQRDAATLVTFVANRVSDRQTMSDIRK